MVINKNYIYNTTELMELILKNNPKYKTSSLYNKIKEMEDNGEIVRIGKSQYVFKTLRLFDYELESVVAKKVDKVIRNNYSNDLECAIYETTTVLNQFLNHLINRNVVIVEIPKIFINHVFNTLKENGLKNVLCNPSQDDVFRYVDDSTIILLPLVSKSPIDRKNRRTTIEKITVDIVCSSVLNCFYEGAELSEMVKDILSNYRVRFDTLKNYAKRRNALDKLAKYIPKTIEALFND